MLGTERVGRKELILWFSFDLERSPPFLVRNKENGVQCIVSPHATGDGGLGPRAGNGAPSFCTWVLMAGWGWMEETILPPAVWSVFPEAWSSARREGHVFSSSFLRGLWVLPDVNEIVVTRLPLHHHGCCPLSPACTRTPSEALGSLAA